MANFPHLTRNSIRISGPLLMCLLISSPTLGETPTVSFRNDVVPVLTKAGCNMGICHAKANGGQNGFELSLLGFEPNEDYESLVKGHRGRRLFLAAPEKSLILLKASGAVPHEGGVRLPADSAGYQTLHRWIAQGAPADEATTPELLTVEVAPDKSVHVVF